VLESSGYKLLIAKRGDEALSLADGRKGPIKLLLTDIVMPGMSGPELAGRLAAQGPEMKVLYMSGCTDDTVVRHHFLEPDTPFLQKPFKPASLARKVREVLDAVQQ
jgi:two-component system cell cycle sensor histidine kinase/response regulator CckA